MAVGGCGVVGMCGCDEKWVDSMGSGVILWSWVLDLGGCVGATCW